MKMETTPYAERAVWRGQEASPQGRSLRGGRGVREIRGGNAIQGERTA
jgi:hypothetical protein